MVPTKKGKQWIGVVVRGRVLLSTAAAVAAVAGLMVSPLAATADSGPYALIQTQVGAQTMPVRWNPCQTEITYTVNTRMAVQRGKPRATAVRNAQAEVIRAVGRMQQATGIQFRFAGATTAIPTGDAWYERQGPESEIVIAYANQKVPSARSSLLAGAWGQGGQVYMYDDQAVVAGRGFVVLDAAKAATLRPGFGTGARRGNLVLHELAHVMGLDHVNASGQLMHPRITSRTPNGFAAGDLAGLARIGRAAGCIDVAAEFWPGS